MFNDTKNAGKDAFSGKVSEPRDIPETLINIPAWVFWRWEDRGGKRTKVPYSPKTGFKAEADDPNTWATFDEAARACHERGGCGLGIFFSEDTLLAGTDLDDCIDPATGELHPEARRIVNDLGTYAEVSPSGTGVKAIGYAVKPGDRCRTKNTPWGGEIELYDSGRFFTVTGEHLPGTPHEIRSCKAAYKRVYLDYFGEAPATVHYGGQSAAPCPPEDVPDDEIIGMLEEARNGDKFRALFYGEPDPDRLSEDDMALAFHVTFYTGGDADRAEQIIRRSLRERDKWDERRGNTTWIRQRIERAIAHRNPEDFYDWGGNSVPASLSLSSPGRQGHLDRESRSLVDRDTPHRLQALPFSKMGTPQPTPWIVKGWIPGGGFPSMLYGAGGEGKSYLALDLAIAVAAGDENWMGFKVNPTRVLYVDFELDENVQLKRAYDLAAGRGDEHPPDDLIYVSALDTAPEEAFAGALDQAIEQDCGLVIVDSVGPAMEGDAEDSTDVLGFLKKNVTPFRAAGISPLLLDHQAKVIKGERPSDKLPFGSVYKFNMCRSVIQARGDQDTDALSVTLTHKKTNFGKKQDAAGIRLTFGENRVGLCRDDIGAHVESDEPTTEDEIVAALDEHGPMYPDEIAGVTGIKPKTVKNKLTALKRAGRVKETGEKRGQSLQIRVARPKATGNGEIAPKLEDAA